jgi:hypothetical protein
MNLYGWSFEGFLNVLGSKNQHVLQSASELLEKAVKDKTHFERSKKWLNTLINEGFPLSGNEGLVQPEDGGLVTFKVETELHSLVLYCIARAMTREGDLDLSMDSSNWHHSAAGALYNQLNACGFTKSKACSLEFSRILFKLACGSPLFGAEFKSDWSFYSILTHQELATLLPSLQSALEFERKLPPEYGPQFLRSLSKDGKAFVSDLLKWFGQIHQSGQDALVYWW